MSFKITSFQTKVINTEIWSIFSWFRFCSNYILLIVFVLILWANILSQNHISVFSFQTNVYSTHLYYIIVDKTYKTVECLCELVLWSSVTNVTRHKMTKIAHILTWHKIKSTTLLLKLFCSTFCMHVATKLHHFHQYAWVVKISKFATSIARFYWLWMFSLSQIEIYV